MTTIWTEHDTLSYHFRPRAHCLQCPKSLGMCRFFPKNWKRATNSVNIILNKYLLNKWLPLYNYLNKFIFRRVTTPQGSQVIRKKRATLVNNRSWLVNRHGSIIIDVPPLHIKLIKRIAWVCETDINVNFGKRIQFKSST